MRNDGTTSCRGEGEAITNGCTDGQRELPLQQTGARKWLDTAQRVQSAITTSQADDKRRFLHCWKFDTKIHRTMEEKRRFLHQVRILMKNCTEQWKRRDDFYIGLE